MQNANAKVGAGGAPVLNWNGWQPTGETLQEGMEVQTGMMFEGPFDGNGRQGEEPFRYFEVATADGREVWVDSKHLVELTPA